MRNAARSILASVLAAALLCSGCATMKTNEIYSGRGDLDRVGFKLGIDGLVRWRTVSGERKRDGTFLLPDPDPACESTTVLLRTPKGFEPLSERAWHWLHVESETRFVLAREGMEVEACDTVIRAAKPRGSRNPVFEIQSGGISMGQVSTPPPVLLEALLLYPPAVLADTVFVVATLGIGVFFIEFVPADGSQRWYTWVPGEDIDQHKAAVEGTARDSRLP